jgi:starvation-inducible DNA-binding protein
MVNQLAKRWHYVNGIVKMNETAKEALANTFVMYFKSQSYHWNVEGVNFPQMHEFFGDLYEELQGAVDPFAEQIRALGEYAPKNLDEIFRLKSIDGDNVATNASAMVADLLIANNQSIVTLNKLFGELDTAGEQGFADFVAGRLDAHKKHGWMLKSILKTGE